MVPYVFVSHWLCSVAVGGVPEKGELKKLTLYLVTFPLMLLYSYHTYQSHYFLKHLPKCFSQRKLHCTNSTQFKK